MKTAGLRISTTEATPCGVAALAVGLLFFLLPLSTQAQVNFQIPSLDVIGTEVHVQCMVTRGGERIYPNRNDFDVFIDGRRVVSDIVVNCRDSVTGRVPMSAALVFDASGSMIGAPNTAAKAGGRAFIDLMDGVADEATLLFFNANVYVAQQMTSIKPLLYAGVDGLPAGGGTNLWDATYDGIIELTQRAVSPLRALVVLSDGMGASSTRTPTEIRELAVRNRIPVYFIAIPPAADTTQMGPIVRASGGRMFIADSLDLIPSMYEETHAHILASTGTYSDTCVVIIPTGCADGLEHDLEIHVRAFGTQTDTARTTYTATTDASIVQTALFRFGTVEGSSRGAVNLPLLSLPVFPRYPFETALLPPLRFDLLYDTNLCSFEGVLIDETCLLNGVALATTAIPGGIRFETTEAAAWTDAGYLRMLDLRFRLKDVTDTTDITVRAENAHIFDVCLQPVIQSGTIHALPYRNDVFTLDCGYLDTLTSSDRNGEITIRVRGTNDGGGFLADMQATALLPSLLSLANGEVPIKTFSPDTLSQWQAGMPVPQLDWKLVYVGPPACHDQYLPVQVLVSGKNEFGETVDFTCTINILVRGVDTKLKRITLGLARSITVCEGDLVRFDAGAGFTGYLWSTQDTTQSITVSAAGDYYCQVWTEKCYLGYSDTVTVIVNPKPAVPVITRSGNLLIVDGGYASYTWYADGLEVQGQRGDTLHILRTGQYHVLVTNIYGCMASSELFPVTVLGVDDPSAGDFALEIHPLPARDAVILRAQNAGTGDAVVSLYDRLGRLLLQREIRHGAQGFETRIAVDGLAPGIYFLHFQSATHTVLRLLPVL
jgi:hypothetical protein